MKNKLLSAIWGTSLLCIVAGWILFGFFGYRVMEVVYHSNSIPLIDKLLSARSTTPLEAYYEAAEYMMLLGTYWVLGGVVLSSLFTVLINRPLGALLACFSFLVCSFSLFSFIELFPSLIMPLHLNKIEYYAYKANYLPDDQLGFREKPLISVQINNFRGANFSPLYGIDIPPQTVKWATDRDGFRGTRPKRFYDIVVIGDSYIEYGYTENDIFPKRLENRLGGLSVSNLGKSGYGPFQYLEVLKRYGLEKNPQVAVFAFYEGNDIHDIQRYLQWKKALSQAGGKHAAGVPRGNDYAEVYALLKSRNLFQRYVTAFRGTVRYIGRLIWLTSQLTVKRVFPQRATIHPKITDLDVGHKHYKMLFVDKLDKTPTEQMLRTAEWIELKRILIDFKAVCAQNHILPLILYIPAAAHIYAEYSTEHSGRDWLRIRDGQVAAKHYAENAMIQLSQELNLRLLNLSLPFEAAAANGKMIYHSFDSHWNSDGVNVAAAFVAERLKSISALLPREETPRNQGNTLAQNRVHHHDKKSNQTSRAGEPLLISKSPNF